MTLASLRRGLLLAALSLFLCLSAAAQKEEPQAEAPAAEAAPAETAPAPAAAEAAAGALIDAGRFEEAIVALRPLLEQESIVPNALFLYGVASLEASQRPGRTDEERETLLDEAIAAFHVMLVQAPGLVRVRLELARAFFLKGEDQLAQRHFEAVLAGGVPDAVAANVNLFLNEIRSRGRWSFNVGFALAPDSNIGAGSEERTIYISVFGRPLPFERDAEELTSSGIGVSVWGGAEYQVPIGERLRLRAGGEAARREYEGSQFDQLYLATHLGPRWLLDQNTEGSLLASARQRWIGTVPDNRELGARLEVARRLTPRVTVFANASWHDRRYRRREHLDGPVMDASLRGSWVVTPTVRAEPLGGVRARAARARPRAQRQPLAGRGGYGGPAAGLHRGRRRRDALDRLRGRVVSTYAGGREPGGPHPERAALGAQPGLHDLWLQPRARGGERGAGDQRAALRLQAHARRAEIRAAVLAFSFPSTAGARLIISLDGGRELRSLAYAPFGARRSRAVRA